MIELRWLKYQEEEAVVPAAHEIQYGKPFDRAMVTKRKLQYRQKIDTTIRAGMWDAASMANTANMQWSEWHDVPEYLEN
jgi:Flp pilus assembly protein CpaB